MALLFDQSGFRTAIVFDLQCHMTDVELFPQYLLCLRADPICFANHHVVNANVRFKVIVMFPTDHACTWWISLPPGIPSMAVPILSMHTSPGTPSIRMWAVSLMITYASLRM